MSRILSVFSRSGGLLVFLILEAICLMLVVNYNKGQRDIYKNSRSLITDNITSKWSGITDYWNLGAKNDSLAGVIADLRAEQDEAKFQNAIRQDSVSIDTFQHYTYTAAKVTSNTINLPNNFLILNRGTEHEINTHMGVFDDKGIIGIVVSSNRWFSKVMSILHRDSKISVEIKGLNAPGTLVWEGTNPTIMELKYIPKHIDPQVGDTIQTNGYSTHFPTGIMVGRIIDISKDKQGGNFHEIKIRLSNDIATAKYVYIVNNLLKEEQSEIMKEDTDDE